MFYIIKEFTLHTAHALTKSYLKDLQEIHGHDLKVKLFLQRKEKDLNRMSKIIDPYKLEDIFKNTIEKDFQYRLVLNYSGEAKIKTTEFKIKYVDFNPTIEKLAEYVLIKINEELESENCFCFQCEIEDGSGFTAVFKHEENGDRQ